jgi:DNA-binding NtrC family response regulator
LQKHYKILIADDDADVIGSCLAAIMHDVPEAHLVFAKTPQETLTLVKTSKFDLILLDIHFSPGDARGLGLISAIQAISPSSKIVMLSGCDDGQTVISSLHLGAVDFFSKNGQDLSEIKRLIKNFIKTDVAEESDYQAGLSIANKIGAVFASTAMADVFAKVAVARRSLDLPVLITGETGVGKEVIARAINADTGRSKVDVDCAAIPTHLFESEFFGHKRGSFTGADRDKLGKFQLAHKGDLFLDEIGNLPKPLQEKFLRAVQYQEITPVGGSAPQKVSVRIIAATNAGLVDQVANGNFRHDLLERLKGLCIEIPALRDRPEDIEPLLEHLIARSNKPTLKIAQTCINLLKSYSWPGNVRELELVAKEMIARCHGDQLTIIHFSDSFKKLLTADLKLCSAKTTADSLKNTNSGKMYQVPLDGTLKEVMDHFLAFYLADRLKMLGAMANKAELARSLDVSRNTIIEYFKRLNIAPPGASDA